MSLKIPNPDFKGTPLFDIEYLRKQYQIEWNTNKKFNALLNGITSHDPE